MSVKENLSRTLMPAFIAASTFLAGCSGMRGMQIPQPPIVAGKSLQTPVEANVCNANNIDVRREMSGYEHARLTHSGYTIETHRDRFLVYPGRPDMNRNTGNGGLAGGAVGAAIGSGNVPAAVVLGTVGAVAGALGGQEWARKTDAERLVMVSACRSFVDAQIGAGDTNSRAQRATGNMWNGIQGPERVPVRN